MISYLIAAVLMSDKSKSTITFGPNNSAKPSAISTLYRYSLLVEYRLDALGARYTLMPLSIARLPQDLVEARVSCHSSVVSVIDSMKAPTIILPEASPNILSITIANPTRAATPAV